jgi:hypothetical protein
VVRKDPDATHAITLIDRYLCIGGVGGFACRFR